MFMGIRKFIVKPGTKTEQGFINILQSVGVNPTSVMCRRSDVFGTECNEYLMSEGLYKQIAPQLEKMMSLT